MRLGNDHGGNVYAAARESGRRLHHLIDFSASINPLGPARRALQAIQTAQDELIHYPDPDCVTLRQMLAERYQLPHDSFVIGNGSSELIHLLPATLCSRHALIVGPTFSEYARAVANHGGCVTYINARQAERYRLQVTEVLAALRASKTRQASRDRIDLVFLCNPNSPTGLSIQAEEVSKMVASASRQGIWVIVDETFVEYCEDRSVLTKVGDNPYLLVLRSFTKFYALPGLRIGYLAGPPKVIERIRERQPPWSVNTLAQAAARAALEDRRHVPRSLTFMQTERPRFAENLGSLPDVTVYPSAANFLLVELPPSMPASRLAYALRKQGLLIR
ncbi:MAG TPA: aminotransferase class I/II-fold pyridoxal phosphate-dependent enzyme, partial [Nitrospiraceae bacterium]|nr:aminotransferase class I/II-fold pyridoxal phosphate-dependent enzyme [Nitrospiraceae bacterium]